eukprot:gene4343-4037_t
MPVGNEVVEQRSVGGRVVALEKSAADITLQYENCCGQLSSIKARVAAMAANAAADGSRQKIAAAAPPPASESAATAKLAALELESVSLYDEADLLLHRLAVLDARIDGKPAPKRKKRAQRVDKAAQAPASPSAAAGAGATSVSATSCTSLKAKMAARRAELAEQAEQDKTSTTSPAPTSGVSPLRAKIEAKKVELGFATAGGAGSTQPEQTNAQAASGGGGGAEDADALPASESDADAKRNAKLRRRRPVGRRDAIKRKSTVVGGGGGGAAPSSTAESSSSNTHAAARLEKLAALELESVSLYDEADLLLHRLAVLDARIEGKPAPKRKKRAQRVVKVKKLAFNTNAGSSEGRKAKEKFALGWLRSLEKRAAASLARARNASSASAAGSGKIVQNKKKDAAAAAEAAAAAAASVESPWRIAYESNIRLLESMLMSDKDMQIREAVRSELEQAIQQSVEGAENVRVETFGSTVSGLAGKSSDVDLVLVVPPGKGEDAGPAPGIDPTWLPPKGKAAKFLKMVIKKVMRKKKRRTKNSKGGKDVMTPVYSHWAPILSAKVPIVQFYDTGHKLDCDLCYGNTLAIDNSKLLKEYCAFDPRFKTLAWLVKNWAKFNELNDNKSGTFSSYALTVMTIHYCQEQGVLPCLQMSNRPTIGSESYTYFETAAAYKAHTPWEPDNDTRTVLDLWVGWLAYFGNLPFNNTVISIAPPTMARSSSSGGGGGGGSSKKLAKLNQLVAAGEGKLKNSKFVDSAPAKIVEGARKQLAETTEKRDETKRILAMSASPLEKPLTVVPSQFATTPPSATIIGPSESMIVVEDPFDYKHNLTRGVAAKGHNWFKGCLAKTHAALVEMLKSKAAPAPEWTVAPPANLDLLWTRKEEDELVSRLFARPIDTFVLGRGGGGKSGGKAKGAAVKVGGGKGGHPTRAVSNSANGVNGANGAKTPKGAKVIKGAKGGGDAGAAAAKAELTRKQQRETKKNLAAKQFDFEAGDLRSKTQPQQPSIVTRLGAQPSIVARLGAPNPTPPRRAAGRGRAFASNDLSAASGGRGSSSGVGAGRGAGRGRGARRIVGGDEGGSNSSPPFAASASVGSSVRGGRGRAVAARGGRGGRSGRGSRA